MSILEVVAVISLAFTALIIGFTIGTKAKNNRHSLRKLDDYFLIQF